MQNISHPMHMWGKKKVKGYIMKNLLNIWPLHSMWWKLEWARGKVPLKRKFREKKNCSYNIFQNLCLAYKVLYGLMPACLSLLFQIIYLSIQPNQFRSLVFARNALMQDLPIISFFYFCLDLYDRSDCFSKYSWWNEQNSFQFLSLNRAGTCGLSDGREQWQGVLLGRGESTNVSVSLSGVCVKFVSRLGRWFLNVFSL